MPAIMWWEHEQLLTHLYERGDIWVPLAEGRYIRSQDTVDVLGLSITPPLRSGPYRMYNVQAFGLAWTQAQADEYLLSLLRKWTDYSTRMRYTEFLVNEAGIDPAKAQSIAIGLCGVEQNGDGSDVEQFPLPTQRELWPDIDGPVLGLLTDPRHLRTFGVDGGGFLTIRLTPGGALELRASLRRDGRYGAGYTGSFTGYLHPRDGNIATAAAFLYGEDHPTWPAICDAESGDVAEATALTTLPNSPTEENDAKTS